MLSQYQNLVEAVGREYFLKQQGNDINRPVEGASPTQIINQLLEMEEDEDNIDPLAKVVYQQSDLLLNNPFDFYGTALSLNSEQQIDLANRNIVRFYRVKVNQLYFDIQGLQGELDATRSLVQDLKAQTIVTERKIQELIVREKIAIEEKQDVINKYDRRIATISKDYVEFIRVQAQKFQTYKELISYEVQAHEQAKDSLEKVFKQKQREVDGLKEVLAIPRQHFKNIERLTNEEIVTQKEKLLDQMSKDMGIPVEVLVEKMYERTAKREAQKLINQAF